MTLSELTASPIGTTDAMVRYNDFWLVRERQFIATHRERTRAGVRVAEYYGETAKEALDKLIASKRKFRL